MIRRGGLCHQGHCQGFLSILQSCFLGADRGQKGIRAGRISNMAILAMHMVKNLKSQSWREMSMIPGSQTYPSLPPYPSFYLFLSFSHAFRSPTTSCLLRLPACVHQVLQCSFLQHRFIAVLMRYFRNSTRIYINQPMVKRVSLYVILLKGAESIDNVKWGLSVHVIPSAWNSCCLHPTPTG